MLHYTHGDGGHWHSIVESAHDGRPNRDAAMDILAIVEAINALSPAAKMELGSCSMREFNIGFHCGDTWSYVHSLPLAVVNAVAKAGCSLAVTLYPMRDSDGTPRE